MLKSHCIGITLDIVPQLSYPGEGLGVTMRRDVRTNQMLSGAVQMDVNVSPGEVFAVRAPPFHNDVHVHHV